MLTVQLQAGLSVASASSPVACRLAARIVLTLPSAIEKLKARPLGFRPHFDRRPLLDTEPARKLPLRSVDHVMIASTPAALSQSGNQPRTPPSPASLPAHSPEKQFPGPHFSCSRFLLRVSNLRRRFPRRPDCPNPRWHRRSEKGEVSGLTTAGNLQRQ